MLCSGAYHADGDGVVEGVDARQLAQHRVEEAHSAEVDGKWPRLEGQQRLKEVRDEPREPLPLKLHVDSQDTLGETGYFGGKRGEQCSDPEVTCVAPPSGVIVVREERVLHVL
eukprot:scaffold36467_cov58-Phaeocystis_antarctica.AAC.5